MNAAPHARILGDPRTLELAMNEGRNLFSQLLVHLLRVLGQEPQLDPLRTHWREYVERPFAEAGIAPPRLVEIRSAYHEVLDPVLRYVRRLAAENPGRYVGVFVPELVEQRWYYDLLHSHRATLLKGLLLWRGGEQVVIINAPWHLRDEGPAHAPHTAGSARSGGPGAGAAGSSAGGRVAAEHPKCVESRWREPHRSCSHCPPFPKSRPQTDG